MLGTINCTYETPCGYCSKWDKKCDKKIGCGDEKPQRGLMKNVMVIDDTMNPCKYCESYEHSDPKCQTCRENNYKFYKFKESYQ
jgi:hypothetical protein